MRDRLARACRNSRALKYSEESNLVEIVDSSWYIEMSEVLCQLTSRIENDKGTGDLLTETWFKNWKKLFTETLDVLPEMEAGLLSRGRKRNASGNSNQSSKRLKMDGSRSRNPSGASSGTSELNIKRESDSDDDQNFNRQPRPKRSTRAPRPIRENEDDSKGSEIKIINHGGQQSFFNSNHFTFVLLELGNDCSFPSVKKNFDSGKGNHQVFNSYIPLGQGSMKRISAFGNNRFIDPWQLFSKL